MNTPPDANPVDSSSHDTEANGHAAPSELAALHRHLAMQSMDDDVLSSMALEDIALDGPAALPETLGEGADLPAEIETMRVPWRRLRRAVKWQRARRRREGRAEARLRSPQVRRFTEWLFGRPLGQALGTVVCLAFAVGILGALFVAFPTLEPSSRLLAFVLGIGVTLMLLLLTSRLLEGLEVEGRVPWFVQAQRLASVVVPIVGVGLLVSQPSVSVAPGLSGPQSGAMSAGLTSIAAQNEWVRFLRDRFEVTKLGWQQDRAEYQQTIGALERRIGALNDGSVQVASHEGWGRLFQTLGTDDPLGAEREVRRYVQAYEAMQRGDYVQSQTLRALQAQLKHERDTAQLEREMSDGLKLRVEELETELEERWTLVETASASKEGHFVARSEDGTVLWSYDPDLWRNADVYGLPVHVEGRMFTGDPDHPGEGLFYLSDNATPIDGSLAFSDPSIRPRDEPASVVQLSTAPQTWRDPVLEGRQKASAIDGFLGDLGAHGATTRCLQTVMAQGHRQMESVTLGATTSLLRHLVIESLYTLAEDPGEQALSFETPHLERKAPAVFPENARKGKREGSVVVKVCVDEEGKPVDVIQASQPLGLGLDAAARNAALKSSWTPARLGSFTTPAWTVLQYDFELDSVP